MAVVRGGSATYVAALVAALPAGTLRTGAAVTEVARDPFGVTVATGDRRERFDAVVMATHADDALRPPRRCRQPRDAAPSAGSSTPRTRVVLHTDERVLPANPRARASWNVDRTGLPPPGRALTMTYHMNRLQSLPGPRRLLRVA